MRKEMLLVTYRTAPSLVPINQFPGEASRVFDRLHQENQLIVLKDDQPAAVILSPKEFSRLSEIEEDYQLLLEANKRLANNIDATTLSREQLMRELNITEAEIANAKDVVIE
ncbi:type II toxin-antitoxin system Phd/YefM family antitoxin [uncultured Selenomonas sp.]|uniref:type II toxin-antitoxin system Phd/YefM family antitoxin n=1 Tax=uncultured Selenomonas sp. TaxID=159275 RepID=UPI0028DC8E50|nr:type II toxin-antitoxin system Phd/YefM family antitoxin [uncultured Selenomonas sp.]